MSWLFKSGWIRSTSCRGMCLTGYEAMFAFIIINQHQNTIHRRWHSLQNSFSCYLYCLLLKSVPSKLWHEQGQLYFIIFHKMWWICYKVEQKRLRWRRSTWMPLQLHLHTNGAPRSCTSTFRTQTCLHTQVCAHTHHFSVQRFVHINHALNGPWNTLKWLGSVSTLWIAK